MTQYSPIILFVLGCVGIWLHNLVKLNRINRENAGVVNYGQYLTMEKFTILISLTVVAVVAFILNAELPLLMTEKYMKAIGIGYIMLGYFAQSILILIMGRAEKYMANKAKEDDENKKP